MCASAAAVAAVGVAGPPAANADTVEPYTSDYGNVDVFTAPAGYVGVEVSNFRLMYPDTQGCTLSARPKGDTSASKSAPLTVSGDGHGKAFAGPFDANGTYFVMFSCDGLAADGKFVGGRGPYTLGSSPIFIDLPAYTEDQPMATIVVHMNGSPTRPTDYPPLPELKSEPLDPINPTMEAPKPPIIVDPIGDPARGSECANRVSGAANALPPGTEAALEQLKQLPKNASLWAMAACSVDSLIHSSNPANDQDVFNSICRTLENALDPLGIGAAKDFFCGTKVS